MDHPSHRVGGNSAVERRRPGRVEYANPRLLGLLRGVPSPAVPKIVELPTDDADSLTAARGIGLSAVVGMLAWAAVAAAIWMVF